MKLSSLPIYPYAQVLVQAAQMLDRKFRVTSFYRSRAQQQKLYKAWLSRGKTGLPAAPPGRSMHELGEAIDIARGVDPFQDEMLAYLGNWWRQAGLGWSESDPVHFQLAPIPQHAAGLAAGERNDLRAPIPTSAAELPIHHPAVTRGLNDDSAPQLTSRGMAMLDQASRAGPGSEMVTGFAKGVGTAALAGLASGGLAGAQAAVSAALAAAPTAVPLAAAGIIASIVLPAISSGEMFSSKIDPALDATTAEGIARSRRQALLIKQDLADTGLKFARKGQS